MDPLEHNIHALAECSCVADIENLYFPDPSGTYLLSKSSVLGKLSRWAFFPLSLLHVTTAQQQLSSIVKTTKTALATFCRFAKGEIQQLPQEIDSLQVMTFRIHSQQHLQHALKIFNLEQKSLPLAVPQQASAPIILEELILRDIPWKEFEKILQNVQLTRGENTSLTLWIQDIVKLGSLISPYLLLATFEVAVRKSFPSLSQEEQGSQVSALSLELLHRGLANIDQPMSGSLPIIEEIDDVPKVTFGKSLPPVHPIEIPLVAYELPQHNRMLLHSPAPLFLGMWLKKLEQTPSVIPYVQRFSWGKRRQYVVTEKLVTSLAHLSWSDLPSSTVRVIASLLKTIMTFPQTPELDPARFFITSEGSIRLLLPLKEGSTFFNLSAIELFISKICGSKLLEVFKEAQFFQHPFVAWHRNTLQRFQANMSERNLLENAPKGAGEEDIIQAYAWRKRVRGHTQQILQRLHSSSEKTSNEIVATIFQLQSKLGFVLNLPENIQELVLQEMAKKI
jgi:hypothetical protein